MKCEHPVDRGARRTPGLCRLDAKWMVDGSAVCTQHKNHSLRRLYATRLVPGWTPPAVWKLTDD